MAQTPGESKSAPPGFDPRKLERTAIAIPLLDDLKAEDEAREKDAEAPTDPLLYPVIIDPHLRYPGGREKARKRIIAMIDWLINEAPDVLFRPGGRAAVNKNKTALSRQYVFARLTGAMIRRLVKMDQERGRNGADKRAIYRIWPDFEVKARLIESIRTVKADAAMNAFGSGGEGIVWAVLDSGIDALHPHFQRHGNLDLRHDKMLRHLDLTDPQPASGGKGGNPALIDRYGHGTHVAGIIAGQMEGEGRVVVSTSRRDPQGNTKLDTRNVPRISGMAPRCKLLSLKVLNDDGAGEVSSVIVALEYIQKLNEYGRTQRVHGVNLSAGYVFEPEWFACGQSPLCVEVDRLVKSGVVVVVAAGNTGYGYANTLARGEWAAGLPMTINDPGNAELAITVGSTHRESPHVYGVSYFSSKGPTGDGRIKPDLVAPGEKILSCTSTWAGQFSSNAPSEDELHTRLANWSRRRSGSNDDGKTVGCYREESGTSMAAPHVSGVVAAFLSLRREFIFQPLRVKEIFTRSATDLKRERSFQGAGLVDLMRAIQSV